MTTATDPGLEARRMRTAVWVVALATVGLIFDGYDLVVYGTVVSTLLRDPSHIGTVTPAISGIDYARSETTFPPTRSESR
jgi:AAHS family benzoate transporter-like MFS transporter